MWSISTEAKIQQTCCIAPPLGMNPRCQRARETKYFTWLVASHTFADSPPFNPRCQRARETKYFTWLVASHTFTDSSLWFACHGTCKINRRFFVKPLFGPRYFSCKTSRQGLPEIEGGRDRPSRFFGIPYWIRRTVLWFSRILFFLKMSYRKCKNPLPKGPDGEFDGFQCLIIFFHFNFMDFYW